MLANEDTKHCTIIRMWPKPRWKLVNTPTVAFHLGSGEIHSLAVQLSFPGHSLMKWRQELDGLKKASWWNPWPAGLWWVLVPVVKATIDKNRIRREDHCIKLRCRLCKNENGNCYSFFPQSTVSAESLYSWVLAELSLLEFCHNFLQLKLKEKLLEMPLILKHDIFIHCP